MARIKVRYYITRPGAAGTLRRFWSPTKELQQYGWELERLPDDEGEAIARAKALNTALDLWRAGKGPAGNHPVPFGAAVPASDRLVTRSDNMPPVALPRPPKATPMKSTVGWLIDDYKSDPKWTAKPGSSIRPLAPATRRQYEWAFGIIRAWANDGQLPVKAITAPRVQALYKAFLGASHSKANTVVTVLRLLLTHAVRRGVIAVNPAKDPGLISLPPRLRIWSREEVDCMLAHADALGWHSLGDAILMAADLGQRESDILALTRLRFAGGTMFLQQQKTRARVAVPATPRLRARIAAAVTRIDAAAEARRQDAIAQGRQPQPAPPWIVVAESTFTRWQPDHFRRMFARLRAAAAGAHVKISRKPGVETMNDEDLLRTSHLPKCRSLLGLPAQDGEPEILQANFQDLRDTAVTNMAEGGATIPEICAVTGHTEKSAYNILKHYLAHNAAMADSAIAKLVELYERQDAERRRAEELLALEE